METACRNEFKQLKLSNVSKFSHMLNPKLNPVILLAE